MYSGEYDVSDACTKCVSTPGTLKSLPPHKGNRTYDLWDTSPMLCQLSYEAKPVRVGDISELSLVPSISMCSYDLDIFLCVFDVMYSGEHDGQSDVTLSVYPHRAG